MLDPGTDLRAAEGRRKHRFTLLDIQKLQRISFLLLTRQFRERRLVARQFDIREEAFQEYPDERIEPVDRRCDERQEAPEIIPAANVPLFMKQDQVQALRIAQMFRDDDAGTQDPVYRRRCDLLSAVHIVIHALRAA